MDIFGNKYGKANEEPYIILSYVMKTLQGRNSWTTIQLSTWPPIEILEANSSNTYDSRAISIAEAAYMLNSTS